jgi:hypothetical protein
MRAIKLDFVHRPHPAQRWGYLLLLIAVVIAAYLGQSYLTLSGDVATWEMKWRALQSAQRKQAESSVIPQTEWQQMQAELKAARRVIAHLSMPWDGLFHEVDASVNDQVTLLSVEPDAEKHEVRITAETKNFSDMLDYVKRVRSITVLKDAYVVSHQIQEQDPQRPVRFIVDAQWIDLPVNGLRAEDTAPAVKN